MLKKAIKNNIVFAVAFAAVLFMAFYLIKINSNEGFSIISMKSFLYAFILNIVNFILAIILYSVSYKKDNKAFIALNLGGMVLRIFLLVLFITIFINFLNIEKVAFIFTFFIFYFSYLIIEIKFYSRKFTINYDSNRS